MCAPVGTGKKVLGAGQGRAGVPDRGSQAPGSCQVCQNTVLVTQELLGTCTAAAPTEDQAGSSPGSQSGSTNRAGRAALSLAHTQAWHRCCCCYCRLLGHHPSIHAFMAGKDRPAVPPGRLLTWRQHHAVPIRHAEELGAAPQEPLKGVDRPLISRGSQVWRDPAWAHHWQQAKG